MSAFCIVLAVPPVLLLCAAIFLAVIVAGIRKGDRRDLAPAPRNRLDAITRRVVGLGVRREDSERDS